MLSFELHKRVPHLRALDTWKSCTQTIVVEESEDVLLIDLVPRRHQCVKQSVANVSGACEMCQNVSLGQFWRVFRCFNKRLKITGSDKA